MKRAIFAVIIFLLLGAATSIAIAWAAVLWDIGEAEEFVLEEHGWVGRLTRRPGRVEIGAVSSTSRLGKWWKTEDGEWRSDSVLPWPTEAPSWSRLHDPPGSQEAYASEIAAGWPLLCLRSIQEGDEWRTRSLGFAGRGGLGGRNPLADLEGDWWDPDALPIGAISWRFAISALLFGAAWFVLLRLPIIWTVNRAIRRRLKGRCPSCGYDRRDSESERCPECGHEGPYRPAVVSAGSLRCATFILLALLAIETAFAGVFVANQPYAPIHRAAWGGDVERIRVELARGVDVDLLTREYAELYPATPLSLAAMNGKPGAIRCLLDAGADLIFRGAFGKTPLHEAAMRGTFEAVQALIDAGADVNAQDDSGFTPLFDAVPRGNRFPGSGAFDPRIMRALIDAGADVDFQSGPMNVLWYTCSVGTIESLQILLESEVTLDSERASLGRFLPYSIVIGPDPIAIAQILLDRGVPVDDEAMRRAVIMNNLELLELLIEHGGDVTARNEDGETLLFELAPLKEHRPLWEFLLGHGVDINALSDRGVSVLMYWLEDDRRRNVGLADRREWVAFVLDRGADPALGERPALNTLDSEIADMLRRAMEESGGADDER